MAHPLHNNIRSTEEGLLRRLEILRSIAEHLNRTVDLQPLLDTALARILELMDLSTGWITLLDERGHFYSAAAHGLPSGLAADDRAALRWAGCSCQSMLLKGEAKEAANILACERLERVRQALRGQGPEAEERELGRLRYHASVPLRTAGQVLGVMNLARPGDEPLSSEELTLLSLVSESLSAAIQRAQLHERVKAARLQEQETLLRLSQTLLGLLEPQAIAQATVDAIDAYLGGGAVGLLVPVAGATHLELIAGGGWLAQHVGRQVSVGSPGNGGLAGVLRTRAPAFADFLPNGLGFAPPGEAHRATTPVSLIVPMVAPITGAGLGSQAGPQGAGIVGIVAVSSAAGQPFSDDQARFLSVVAGQAAIALERARQHAVTREAEARYRGLFDGVPIGLVSVSPEGRLLDANRALLHALGYPDKAALLEATQQINVGDCLVNQSDRERWRAAIERDGMVRDFEVEFRWLDGRQVWVRINARAVLGTDGQVLHYEGSVENVTQRRQMEEALYRRADELAALHATSLDITAPHDLHTLLQVVVERAARLLDAAGGELYLSDPVRREVRCVAGYNVPRECVGRAVGYGEGVAGTVAETGERLIAGAGDEQPAEAVMAVPLIWQNRVTGALVIRDEGQARVFTRSDLGLLTLFAHQAAIAVENARLFTETAEALERQRLLNQVARTTGSTLALPTILRDVVRLAAEAVGAEAGTLALLSPDGETMTYPHLFNLPEDIGPRSLPRGTGIVWRVVETGQPVLLEEYREHPDAVPELVAAGLRATICVPVQAGETPLGGLGLFRLTPDRPFTRQDVILAEAIGRQAGVAVQNARLFQAERVQARRQAALVRLSADLTVVHNEEDICRQVVQGLHDTLGYDFLGLFLVDDTTGERVMQAGIGWPDALPGWRIPPGQGLSERPLLDGRLHYTPDVTQDARYIPGLEQGSELDLPIPVGEKIAGVLVVQTREPYALGQDDFEVLTAAANQAGIALSNARLLAAERRRADELDALRATVTDISAELELPSLLQAVLQRAAALLGATGGDLGLYDPERQEIVIVASHNMGRDYAGVRMTLGEGAMGRVAQTGEPVIIDDYDSWAGRSPSYAGGRWHAVMAAPLLSRGRLVGAIGIVDADPARRFTPLDLNLLMSFAQQAAIAVDNVRLFEAAQRRAEEAETLRQASAVVAATLRQEEAIDRILEQLQRVVPHDSASVQLLHDDYLEIVGGRGWPDPAAVIGLRFPLGRDNPNTVVVRERRSLIVGDPPAAYTDFRQEPHSHIRSWLGVPLIVQDRVIGMLTVDRGESRYFTEADGRLAAVFADQVAIALENARLFRAEQRRREVAAALLDISQVAGSSLDTRQVLRHIAQRTAGACQANRCSIFLLDKTEAYLRPVMSQFADGHADREQWAAFQAYGSQPNYIDDVAAFRAVIRENQPLLLDAGTMDNLVPPRWTRPFGIQKLLLVPLISRDRAIGLMALDHTDPASEFTPEQVELAMTIGGQVSTAIVNTRLYTEVERRAGELATLYEATQAMSGSLALSELTEIISAQLIRLLRVEGCTILLRAAEGDHLVAISDICLDSEEGLAHFPEVEGATFNLADFPATAGVLASREPLVVQASDPEADPAEVADMQRYGVQTLLMLPLVVRGQAIGVLELHESRQRREFSEQDVRLAQSLASHVAVTLENARLYAETQRQAITDGGTGLYNRRYFFEALEKELERSRRYGRPCSLLIIDLDDFKKYNDRYGHLAGDDLLRELAGLLWGVVRQVDVAARYGGEEFAVILPETNSAQALTMAERVREAVGMHEFVVRRSTKLGRVTVSGGVATCPEHAADAEGLVNAADMALLQAKVEKDRVLLAASAGAG